jgi:aminopeptidase-like protein
MNCVEWILFGLECGGVAVPDDVLTPTDLHYWCVAGCDSKRQAIPSWRGDQMEDTLDMMAVLRELGPLPRTLACDATDRSLEFVQGLIPGAAIEGYRSGSQAWGWTVPQRWELRRATLRAGDRLIIDSDANHLHCMNYSEAFSGRVTRAELLAHLHTDARRPGAVPFVFSFYERRWGLCMAHDRLGELVGDAFDVDIDCARHDGEMTVLSALLPGQSVSEFILCATICHPCQANDSLTGLVVALELFLRLARLQSRKYSYRLLVVPETIGSIAYLAHHPEVVSRAVGGVFSEMLGTAGPLVLQSSRRGDTYWDLAARAAIGESGLPWRSVPFMKSASNDEKCLDAPGVDIPTISLTRYPYPEYHTSDDNADLIELSRLREARDVMWRFLNLIESDYVPRLTNPGPIFLSGNGLMPDRGAADYARRMQAFYDVMYALDGERSVVQLSRGLARNVDEVRFWTDAFVDRGLARAEPFTCEAKGWA